MQTQTVSAEIFYVTHSYKKMSLSNVDQIDSNGQWEGFSMPVPAKTKKF